MSMSQDLPAHLGAGPGDLERPPPRACESCRQRKIRCEAPFVNAPGICRPCTLSGRSCIFTEPSKKRRRKRTDARVTELEKQVKAMGAALNQRKGPPIGTTLGHSQYDNKESPDQMLMAMCSDQESPNSSLPVYIDSSDTGRDDLRNGFQYAQTLAPNSEVPKTHQALAINPTDGFLLSSAGDAIDRNLLSVDEASRLFTRYNQVLLPHFPIVFSQEGTKLSEMRSKKPILLLSILAAVASSSNPMLNLRLNREIQQTYADRIAMNGERSLELVQSLLVTVAWYCPPDNFEKLKFYQYLQMAWCMIMDLGLDKRSLSSSIKEPSGLSPGPNAVERDLIEERRSLLSCYLLFSQASVALRRSCAVRFSNRMEESLDLLASSPYAAPTDGRLCAWVRLQRIMEQCVSTCALSDSTGVCNFAETRTQYSVKSFNQQIQDWKENLSPGLMNESLMLFYHVNIIYLHEMAMYVDHDPGDFLPPFIVKRAMRDCARERLPLAYIDAVSTIQSSSQALLETVLQMDFESLRALPVSGHVRLTYALVILTKLSLSAMSAESPLRNLLDVSAIAAATYQSQVLSHLMHAIGPDCHRTVLKFAVIVFKLRSWFIQYGTPISSVDNDGAEIEPCVFLGPEDCPSQMSEPPHQLDFSSLGPEFSNSGEIDAFPLSNKDRNFPYDQIRSTADLLPYIGDLGDWTPEVDIGGLLNFGDTLNFDLDLDMNSAFPKRHDA